LYLTTDVLFGRNQISAGVHSGLGAKEFGDQLPKLTLWYCITLIFRHIKVLPTKKELGKLPPGPKVVLASMASLEEGFSREIFVEWATDVKNLIIFTERGQ
ncbi:hypothetical protein KI387_025153, partial [Taxus chinensis]